MATIETYETSTGAKRYMVRYRTPQSHPDQEARLQNEAGRTRISPPPWKSRRWTGSYVAPSLGIITVGELAPTWLSRKQFDVAPSNYRTLESAWRIHVEPDWGKTRLADVDLNGVERWIATMGKESGATVVIRSYGVLAGILDDAVKSRRLASNPARGVENLPRKSARRHVYLSPEDVGRLAGESGQHRALVLVLAYCGIRWGEAVALRVRDVEFLRRRLSVHDNAVQLGVDHAVGQTKSRQRPLGAGAQRSCSMNCRCSVLDAASRISCSVTARILPRPKSDGGWFAGAVKRAKVQTITPHDLRHSCASIAISSGVNVLGVVADARAHLRQGHAGHLRRFVRHRPRCRRDQLLI